MRARVLSTLLLGALLAAGCRSASTPADFAMRLGESGGFTGWTTGYALTATGEVSRFTDRHDGDVQYEDIGRLTAAQRDELWQTVAASAVFETPPAQGSGDLTRFLEVVGDGRTRRVEWIVGPSQDPPLPAEALFANCRDVLVSASPAD